MKMKCHRREIVIIVVPLLPSELVGTKSSDFNFFFANRHEEKASDRLLSSPVWLVDDTVPEG
jgi:hypothetical protein